MLKNGMPTYAITELTQLKDILSERRLTGRYDHGNMTV